MDKYLNFTNLSWVEIFITSLGIYLAVIIFTRIAGKRSFSKLSGFDFAMTVAIGSIIATTALSASVSLLQGVIGLLSVYVLQISAALLRRFKVFQNILDNTPLLLMDGEKILDHNLRKARVTESDLRSKLRESNVIKISQVKAVVFETTGTISVLHAEDTELESWLLKDVKR